MKNKCSTNVVLQERDFKMLQFVYEMEYCSLKSLWTYAFEKKVTLTTVLGRIFLLKKAGYLGAFKTPNFYVYYIKPKSLTDLRIKFPDNTYSNKARQLSIANIDHTAMISEIRSVLELTGTIKSFKSEKSLRLSESNKKKYIPDGIIQTEDEVQVFELERTLKSDSRIEKRIDEIREIFSDLKPLTDKKISALIVCQTPLIKKKYDQSLYSAVFQTSLIEEFKI